MSSMKKIRILAISMDSNFYGGGRSSFHSILKELNKIKTVDIFFLRSKGKNYSNSLIKGKEIYLKARSQHLKGIEFLLKSILFLRKKNFDVIFTNQETYELLAGYFYKKIKSRPILCLIHDFPIISTEYNIIDNVSFKVRKFFQRKFTLSFVFSNYTRHLYFKDKFNMDKMVIIPIGL